ncbi:hypothetical protein NDU88_010413 [Pleurodeles waltl]|uniref:Uncharacterized protein n=1 Tax=Pleurodeles waltl TaxID=8319 RepID=A0AAV7QUC4_PLEWA|nr:hypothetical protein NDU88_010413 [Pleurodeles waltl]
MFTSARGGTPAARPGPPTRAGTLSSCPPQQGTQPGLLFDLALSLPRGPGQPDPAPFGLSPPPQTLEEGGGRGPACPPLGPPLTRSPQPREHEGLRSIGPALFSSGPLVGPSTHQWVPGGKGGGHLKFWLWFGRRLNEDMRPQGWARTDSPLCAAPSNSAAAGPRDPPDAADAPRRARPGPR